MKKLAIGLAVALSLAAVASASASASQRSFAASEYPATMTGAGEGGVTFSTQNNGGVCSGSLAAALPSQRPIVNAEYNMECTKFGIYVGKLKANGCSFELNSDYNTMDIGPAGCGPMTIQQGTCTTYILPQNGIPATYEAGPTEGGFGTLKISISTSKLKYRECTSTGELRETGTLSATFAVSGRNQLSEQISLSLTKASYANFLSAEKYPAELTDPASGEPVFTLQAGTAQCSKSTYSGSLGSVWEYVEVVPAFAECTVFGSVGGTVSSNGCKFSVSAVLGTQEINCPVGAAVTVSVKGCAASIGSQSGISGGSVTNTTGNNGRSAVNVSYNMTGLSYNATDDSAFWCGFSGVGPKTGGSFTDKAKVEGQDSAGPIAIKVGA